MRKRKDIKKDKKYQKRTKERYKFKRIKEQ